MDHEEIDLTQKHNNSARRKGRFGVHTNKTLKYDPSRKEIESINIVDTEDGEVGIGISLNAHKNWEILKKNNLRTSQDDMEVEYGRIVEIEFDNRFYKRSHRSEMQQRIYLPEPEEPSEDDEPVIKNGHNRKGFFVKQQRNPGKKGVKSYNKRGNTNNNNNAEDNQSRSASSSDSEQDPKQINTKIALVQRHKGAKKIQAVHGPKSKCGKMNCDICIEMDMMEGPTRKNRSRRLFDALDLSSL